MQSALDGLEPISWGLIKFRTWHFRIPKNMIQTPREKAGEDVWGGPAVLLAPGQARPTRARIFSQRSRENTNLIDHARPAGRPVGSACGFLSSSDAGRVALESAVRALPEAAVFASSIPYLDVSADSLAARGRRRRGSRFTVDPAHNSSPCQPVKTSHPCCNICYALLIVVITRVATSAQSCELCGGPVAVQVASLACWHG